MARVSKARKPGSCFEFFGWVCEGDPRLEVHGMYHVRLSVVLSECDDQTLTYVGLDWRCRNSVFNDPNTALKVRQILPSNILSAVVSDHVFSKLRRTKVTVLGLQFDPGFLLIVCSNDEKLTNDRSDPFSRPGRKKEYLLELGELRTAHRHPDCPVLRAVAQRNLRSTGLFHRMHDNQSQHRSRRQ